MIYKYFFKELNYFIFDILFLLSKKRKTLKSKLSTIINLNKFRILIYRLPEKYFRYKNKSKIKQLNSYFVDENFEFAKLKLDISLQASDFLAKIFERSPKISAGERAIKTGIEKNIQINYSPNSSIRVRVSNKNAEKIFNQIFKKVSLNDFLDISSIISGYKVKFSDLVIDIVKNQGDNSNSYWHSDAYYTVVKGFIYLNQIITIDDSPFQYLRDTTQIGFLKNFHDLSINNRKNNSPRISTKDQLEQIKEFKIESHIGEKGTLMLANTSGLHRKGPDNSGKTRYMINFEFKRLNLIRKIIRSFKKLN